MITYVINGQGYESEQLSVQELISHHVGSDVGVAVAINGTVVPRSSWDLAVSAGDSVDILTAVQGG